MSLEKQVNDYGQEQKINNFDEIIKIGDKFLQVRLIQTKKWKERDKINGRFSEPMPRARFVDPPKNFSYIVDKSDLIKMKNRGKDNEKD